MAIFGLTRGPTACGHLGCQCIDPLVNTGRPTWRVCIDPSLQNVNPYCDIRPPERGIVLSWDMDGTESAPWE